MRMERWLTQKEQQEKSTTLTNQSYVKADLVSPNIIIKDFLSNALRKIHMKYKWNYPKLRLSTKSQVKSGAITQKRKPKKR